MAPFSTDDAHEEQGYRVPNGHFVQASRAGSCFIGTHGTACKQQVYSKPIQLQFLFNGLVDGPLF
jgi:hypothetical protein